jgi:hypothetical protein
MLSQAAHAEELAALYCFHPVNDAHAEELAAPYCFHPVNDATINLAHHHRHQTIIPGG